MLYSLFAAMKAAFLRKLIIGAFIGITPLTIAGAVGFSVVPVAEAQGAVAVGSCSDSSATFLGMPTWYKYLNPTQDASGDCNLDFEFPSDIGKVLLAIFEILLRVSGIVAVGYVIFGGIRYVISQGEPDKLASSRTTIINALVGLVIALTATVVVNLLARNLG